MDKVISIKKGLDIKIEGKAQAHLGSVDAPSTFAVKPVDFKAIRPKLLVAEGDEVKAGTPLAFNRKNDQVMITAPVSGEIVKIQRGPKRVLEAIVILADKTTDYEDFGAADPNDLDREAVVEKLCKSGAWTFLRRRPFDITPLPSETPKSIFISGFDSAPLSTSQSFALKGKQSLFQTGIDALAKLTDGKVHLGLSADQENASALTEAKNVEKHYFSGPHPAGNVGIQIHHVDPINRDEAVWYIKPQDVANIGYLFQEGKYHPERVVAVAGSEVQKRLHYKTILGANIAPFVKNNVSTDKKLRYISGNVLTGKKIDSDGFFCYFDDLLTVIPEGDQPEFLGWLLPSYPRPSMSKTFPWTFDNEAIFKVDTNTNGEERPFVISGQYEKVLPMDLYPVFLLKAILAEDFDKMEGLGIYEVAAEDFALCEFVCTSKMPVQEIIERGLDIMREEG